MVTNLKAPHAQMLVMLIGSVPFLNLLSATFYRFPTKESVATSVLSTRWRYLFASLADIDLQFKSTYRPKVRKSVLEFIDSQRLIKFLYLAWRILQFRDGFPLQNLHSPFSGFMKWLIKSSDR